MQVAWAITGDVRATLPASILSPFDPNSGARLALGDDAQATPAAKTQISCFPNPVGERLTLQANVAAGESWTVAIYNQVGQMVWHPTQYQSSQNQVTLDLNNEGLAPGIYTVRVQDGNKQQHALKFIKNR